MQYRTSNFPQENNPSAKSCVESKNQIVPDNYNSLVDQISKNGYHILSQTYHHGEKTIYSVIQEKNNQCYSLVVYDKRHQNYSKALHEHIIREARFLMDINHSAIEKVFDYDENEFFQFVTREQIDGHSLRALLNQTGTLSEDTIYRWAEELCSVLQFAHSHFPFLFYSVMNPDHIIVQHDGTLKLFEFTHLLFNDHNIFIADELGYCAPEAFSGVSSCDFRTDIYALGSVLYHMATGRNPSEPPYAMDPIRQHNRLLSADLEKTILRCTQRDPAKRFQSCEELMSAIKHRSQKEGIFRKWFLPHKT